MIEPKCILNTGHIETWLKNMDVDISLYNASFFSFHPKENTRFHFQKPHFIYKMVDYLAHLTLVNFPLQPCTNQDGSGI